MFTDTPHFDRRMRSEVTVGVGDSAVLECYASGAPKPVISWFKDDTKLQRSSDVVYAESGQLLVIPQVKDEDSGSYACEATNSQGTVSHRVELIIETGILLRTTLPKEVSLIFVK